MCKREHNFLIKVYYLYTSSPVKKSAYILKEKLIFLKKAIGLQSQDDFPSLANM